MEELGNYQNGSQFERPNKKSEEVRRQEKKEGEFLKTIGKQKVEIYFLKKVQATVRRGTSTVDKVEVSCRGLSISHQCGLLGISRSQHYYQPSLEQEKRDFKLLVRIREVQVDHPCYGYIRMPSGNVYLIATGLVVKEGTQLEGIQHHGCTAMCQPSEGNHRGVRLSCHIQHGSGKPVHL